MMVTVNYRDKLKQAYEAGAMAALLHQLDKKMPKPDAEAWLKRQEHPPTVIG